VLAIAAVAQTAAGPANTLQNMPDMRLWSFGKCDNRFPFVNSNEHKECVRVVGSEEARDARALRVCETSNPRDPEEVARCKATYHRNKQASAQSGFVPNANGAAQTQAPPSEEELKRVKAIAAAAVERDREAARTAAAAAEPDEPIVAPDEEEAGFPTSLLIAFGFTALLLGAIAASRRRNGGAIFGR
jgi:hypothetical protein